MHGEAVLQVGQQLEDFILVQPKARSVGFLVMTRSYFSVVFTRVPQ